MKQEAKGFFKKIPFYITSYVIVNIENYGFTALIVRFYHKRKRIIEVIFEVSAMLFLIPLTLC